MEYFKKCGIKSSWTLIILLVPLVNIQSGSLDIVMNKTIDTWTTIDTIRAIACEDRHHLYPQLVQANLDLYATTYWLTEHDNQPTIPSSQYLEEMNHIFTTLVDAQQDTVSCTITGNPAKAEPNNFEGLCSCMILNQTKLKWDLFAKKFTSDLK